MEMVVSFGLVPFGHADFVGESFLARSVVRVIVHDLHHVLLFQLGQQTQILGPEGLSGVLR